MMVVNHAGNHLLDTQLQRGGPMAVLVFIGSFAPVVFFFTTGFGAAISRSGTPNMFSVLQKAALLLVADQFFFWRHGAGFGLDFLGFIALASVLSSWLMTRPRPFAAACLAIAVIAALRFGLGPRLATVSLGAWGDWLIGVRAVANVSYPFSPWMALPMFGLAVGLRYPSGEVSESAARRWQLGSLAAAAVLLCLSAGAAAVGASFFRWGSMGLGFFLLSFAVIALCGWFSMVGARSWPRVARVLSIRGVASFAVVPVHYVAIDLTEAMIGHRLTQGEFIVTAVVLVVISFALSKLVATAVRRLVAPGHVVVAIGLACITFACGLALQLAALDQPGGRMALMVLGQLAIAGLLGFRAIKRVDRAVKPAVP